MCCQGCVLISFREESVARDLWQSDKLMRIHVAQLPAEESRYVIPSFDLSFFLSESARLPGS